MCQMYVGIKIKKKCGGKNKTLLFWLSCLAVSSRVIVSLSACFMSISLELALSQIALPTMSWWLKEVRHRLRKTFVTVIKNTKGFGKYKTHIYIAEKCICNLQLTAFNIAASCVMLMALA